MTAGYRLVEAVVEREVAIEARARNGGREIPPRWKQHDADVLRASLRSMGKPLTAEEALELAERYDVSQRGRDHVLQQEAHETYWTTMPDERDSICEGMVYQAMQEIAKAGEVPVDRPTISWRVLTSEHRVGLRLTVHVRAAL